LKLLSERKKPLKKTEVSNTSIDNCTACDSVCEIRLMKKPRPRLAKTSARAVRLNQRGSPLNGTPSSGLTSAATRAAATTATNRM